MEEESVHHIPIKKTIDNWTRKLRSRNVSMGAVEN